MDFLILWAVGMILMGCGNDRGDQRIGVVSLIIGIIGLIAEALVK
ncbi:MAG: hypothetical protein SFW66_08970 [Gammaproteobacteria bacterium]|nr:hypothetical protein [Gammaproteobacteria bacterium]